MGLPLDPHDKNFAKILAAKNAVAASVVTATARVNAGLLRPQSNDGMDAVFQAMEAARRGEDVFTDDEPEIDIFA